MKRSLRPLTVAAACLCLALAGCVSQPAPGPGPNAQGGACAESPGVTRDSIALGVLTDLSGPVSAGGVPWSKGVQAYFDHVNATEGGVGGRRIEVKVADHGYAPPAALQRYQELEPTVLALPLGFGSAANNAVAGRLVDDCMSLIANNGSLTDSKPNVFYNASTYESQALTGISWYLKDHPNPRVALLYQGDVYGEGVKAALEYAAAQRGFEIVSAQSYAVGDQSFSGQLAAITAARPDVVVMATTVGATFTFFGAAQAAGATWDWLGIQPTFAPAVLGLPIRDAYLRDFTITTGQPLVAGGGPATTVAYDTLRAVSPALADDPSSLLGWQAAYLMHQALLVADRSPSGLTRGSVLDALSHLDVQADGLGPGGFRFDPASAEPGVPYDQASIVRIDPAAPGFLTPVERYTTSDLVAGFLQRR
ncbi:ABC transporter substrate-binding protein [Pseudonocardia sp. WMMC193]|uniref:ABC transporter substrate-binding protein n=1 Tax=Pseudonocardia sp. WMMC193 TaxID=2911965 RepID=UPI001F3FE59D|nr:ABC transporter substrate-binding protein [Pseudonocardia sp. WMMC193]MCF7547929.1 ABC transporter substrate-binding protein [Pseudonocardia sp. WMMC193]